MQMKHKCGEITSAVVAWQPTGNVDKTCLKDIVSSQTFCMEEKEFIHGEYRLQNEENLQGPIFSNIRLLCSWAC